MRCSNCQSRLAKLHTLALCPICGQPVTEGRKPSFERTWALMEEDRLKKKPDQKSFEAAWNWYLKALQANPQETIDAIQFLSAWPQFQPDLAVSFSQDAVKTFFGNETAAADVLCAADQLLLASAVRLDPSSLLQLHQRHPEWDESLKRLLEENQASLSELLLPLYHSLRHEYPQARAAFRTLQKMEADDALILDAPQAAVLLCGVEQSLPERLEQLQILSQDLLAELEAGAETQPDVQPARSAESGAETAADLERLVNLLYRPLLEEENAFGHLYELPAAVAAVLQKRTDLWKEQTKALLERDEVLRGIHLALQTLKNQNPDLAEACDELLDLQYQKAYLRPFAQIEATDTVWNV